MPGWDADQAVDVLYHAHYRALTRLAALLVTDVAAAEEIVQAAFAAMHGGWQHLRDSDKALAFLLRKVVIGARSHHAASPALPSREPGRPQAVQPAITAPQALLAALQALPARQREALVLRYYAGLPDTQIAAALGTSARAVTCHIGCGLSSLQAGQRGTERSPFVGGTLVAAGPGESTQVRAGSRPGNGTRRMQARGATKKPGKGRRRGDRPARHPDPTVATAAGTASPYACRVPATPAIRSSAAPDHAGGLARNVLIWTTPLRRRTLRLPGPSPHGLTCSG